jgi:hypothetical protein
MWMREKLKWGTFARFVQWHVTGGLGLRNITFKITIRHQVTVFFNTEAIIYSMYTWNVYHFTVTLLINWKAQEWKLNTFEWMMWSEFCVLHLQTFSEGIVNSPANNISVLSFRPHVVKQVKGNCGHCSTSQQFWQTGCHWWHTYSFLDIPQKEKVMGYKVWWIVGQMIGPPLPIHFFGNFSI